MTLLQSWLRLPPRGSGWVAGGPCCTFACAVTPRMTTHTHTHSLSPKHCIHMSVYCQPHIKGDNYTTPQDQSWTVSNSPSPSSTTVFIGGPPKTS